VSAAEIQRERGGDGDANAEAAEVCRYHREAPSAFFR
jgi:hypothetical protein